MITWAEFNWVTALCRAYLLQNIRPVLGGITPFELTEWLKAQGVPGLVANFVFRELRLRWRLIDADPANQANLRWAGNQGRRMP